MTQQDLAEKINKTRPLISSVEQTGQVSIYTLRKICDVLGLDPYEIEKNTEEDSSGSLSKKEESKLVEKINSLEKQILRLEELVESQKDVIKMLRDKKTPKRK
ncbi:MAG: helix-turn-helix domain-containing protein [Bacteroidia bacterium]|nr:helix-turn-helix domain-containing protein [Bacteroidia bacterium]